VAILRNVILGFLVAFAWLGNSEAETIAATPGGEGVKVYKYQTSFGTSGKRYAYSASDVCQEIAPFVRMTYPSAVFANTYSGSCNYTYAPAAGAASVSGWSGGLICPEIDDGNTSNPVTCATVYTCPADGNWTLSGTQCIRPDCVSPQVRQSDGTCNAPPCVSGESVSGSYFAGWRVGPKPNQVIGADGGAYAVPTGMCQNGCAVTVTTGECTSSGGSYVDTPQPISCTGTGVKTGSTCTSDNTGTPSTTPTVPNHRPKCAADEGVLTSSSGTVACVPSSTPSSTPVVSSSKQVQQFPDGSSKTTETTYTKDPATGVQDTQQSITNTPAPPAGLVRRGRSAPLRFPMQLSRPRLELTRTPPSFARKMQGCRFAKGT